jgi:flagellar motility protein MotE (MotC chaperone)
MKILKNLRSKRRNSRGVILLIVLLFTGSGAIRIAIGAGDAFAGASEVASPPSDMAEGMTASPADIAQTAISRPQMQSLLEALQAREARVAEREKQIEMRTKALSVANEEIEKRLVALEQVEATLRATLSLADGAAEDDLTRLTAVYESMKPKDAATLFETMEPDFAAGFLGRMRPDAAASVMAGLSPTTAYSISVILAGRNAKVPKS